MSAQHISTLQIESFTIFINIGTDFISCTVALNKAVPSVDHSVHTMFDGYLQVWFGFVKSIKQIDHSTRQFEREVDLGCLLVQREEATTLITCNIKLNTLQQGLQEG